MRSHNFSERPEVAPADALPEQVEVTLLFCDVVRSTELTRRLGDCEAYGVIRNFHDVVLRACAPCEGEELELRGDGVLLAFETPRQALACAIEIQRGLLEAPQRRRVSVRIGLHTGSALRKVEGGYFGRNVILSARLASAAAPGEILVSAELVQRLDGLELSIDAGRWVQLKGIPEPNLVFSMRWRSDRAPVTELRRPSRADETPLLAPGRAPGSIPKDDESSCMLEQRSAV